MMAPMPGRAPSTAPGHSVASTALPQCSPQSSHQCCLDDACRAPGHPPQAGHPLTGSPVVYLPDRSRLAAYCRLIFPRHTSVIPLAATCAWPPPTSGRHSQELPSPIPCSALPPDKL